MTPTQALMAIQTIVDHSQKWHDGTSSRNISSISNTYGLDVVVSKLDNLGHDMNKLKENVHAIQVGCQICEGPHLDKECPLNEEVKQVEKVKYGKFGRLAPFNGRASVNFMPRGIFEFLKLIHFRKTNMLIEMADMTKKAPLEMVENILVGIDKFLFPFDFVIINKTPNETIILGNDRIIVDIEKKDHNFMISMAKILMMNSIGHTNVNGSVKKDLLKSWVIDCFEDALDPDKDPMKRSFDDYK
nr:hypothetical protein [Tanacetum cinerariifolium]